MQILQELHQWRTEGLQRPRANAWIGAPPPPPPTHHTGLHGWRLWGSGCPPRLVNPASAPGGKNDKQKKKKKKKGLQHEKVERPPDA